MDKNFLLKVAGPVNIKVKTATICNLNLGGYCLHSNSAYTRMDSMGSKEPIVFDKSIWVHQVKS